MKPTSTYQRHIVELSNKLPSITEKQKQWAFDHCFETGGYQYGDNVWCMYCGETFRTDNTTEFINAVVGGEAICPHCGRKLKLENSRKKKFSESWYYTIITTFKGFQVCRHFIVEKWMRRDRAELRKPYYTINEAVQNWIDENGRETIIARPCKALFRIYDAWDFSKPMEIRRRRQTYNYNPDKYDIEAKYIYPRRSVLPKIKRNGYLGRFHGISASELFKILLTDREAEILAKNGQFDLLRHKHKRGYKELPFAHAIRIANRNKYIIKDASMWFDYMELLVYFNLDTHNAHYVCPRNLKAVHDSLLAKKDRIEAKLELERKMAEARKWEAQYQETKGKFFGICFGNEDIVITVIQSVAEMAEEGQAMHHCVFQMEYYKKPNSLILSAKDRNGKRIETIEIDLKTFKVVQSRGVCNKNTAKHEEILKLVRDNIKLIKQAA